MLSLGVLDKLFAVLENAELLGVEVARHLANRCALLQSEEIFNISIEVKQKAIWCGPLVVELPKYRISLPSVVDLKSRAPSSPISPRPMSSNFTKPYLLLSFEGTLDM